MRELSELRAEHEANQAKLDAWERRCDEHLRELEYLDARIESLQARAAKPPMIAEPSMERAELAEQVGFLSGFGCAALLLTIFVCVVSVSLRFDIQRARRKRATQRAYFERRELSKTGYGRSALTLKWGHNA